MKQIIREEIPTQRYSALEICRGTLRSLIKYLYMHVRSKTMQIRNKTTKEQGAWVAQPVRYLTFDLSSGHDLRVVSSSPALGCALGVEPTKNKNKNPP